MQKIDPNKLLSPSKDSKIQKRLDSSVLVPLKNIEISSKTISIPKLINKPEKSGDDLESTVVEIKNSVLQIEKILKRNTNLLKKQTKINRKSDQNERRREKEEGLEKKKSKKDKFPNLKKPDLPRTGIVDYIKNFLSWVIIGRAFVLFGKYLPKLVEFLKNLKPLYDLFKVIGGALFNGLVTFVEWTDKAKKKVREIAGSLGGEPFQKVFDNFSGALTTFANLALIAGMATMGGSDLGIGDALDDVAPDGKKPKGSRNRPRVTTSGGRRAGGPGLRNPLRQKPRITRTPGLRNPLRQKPRITRTPGLRNPLRQRPKITGANNLPGNAPKLPPSAGSAGKLGAKTLLKTVRPLLRGMIIGGLIDFGLSVALGENPGRAAFGAIGATLLGTIGGILGGPFAAFTAIGGGMLGDWAGRKLYDAFFTGKKSTPSKPQPAGGGMGGRRGSRKMKSGGSIQPKTGKVLRNRRTKPSKNNLKKPSKLPPKKLIPGKDIGGEQKIKKLFPNTDPDSLTVQDWINATDANGDPFAGTYKDYVEMRRRVTGRKPNPFKALTKTSEILKKIPVIGEIMGGAVDVSMGQAFDAKTMLSNFSSSIGYVIDYITQGQVNNSIASLASEVRSFAEGGSIPRTDSINKTYNSISSGELIAKILGPSIEQRVNEAILNIQKEIQKKGKGISGEDEKDLNIQPGNIKVTSESPDFWLLVTASLFENGKPDDGYQGAADVAQAIYNRVSLPGWPKSIREVILEGDGKQFQPVRSYGTPSEWSQINSRESAIAFAKKYKGYTGNIVDQIAATLLDTSKQQKARDYIGPRDNFRSDSYEKSYDNLDDSTEVSRYGHTFGFEPRGANIGKFKKGELRAAEVNKKVVTGTVETPSVTPTKGAIGVILPQGNPKFTSKYGFRDGRMHRGHDYGVDANSPVLSAEDGTVESIVKSFGGWGDAIYVKNSEGDVTVYGHVNLANGISEGVKVKKGQTIATVKYWPQGAAGAKYPDNTHLHLERIEGTKHIDPSVFVNSLQVPQTPAKPTVASVQEQIFNMKLGDTLNVPGIGKVEFKSDPSNFGVPTKKYYDQNNKMISEKQFYNTVQTGKSTPSQKVFDANKIALANLNDRIKNLKLGEKIVFNKVGSIQMGTGWLGGKQIKYYDPSGFPISKETFNERFNSSEVLNRMQSNDKTVQNLYGGGSLDMNYKNINKPTRLNIYEEDDISFVYVPVIIKSNNQNQYIASKPTVVSGSSMSFIKPQQQHNLHR